MLYIVATPLGNLDDLSVRQAKTLVSSDIILAEDTRSAYKLLKAIVDRFGFKSTEKQIVRSFYREKEYTKTFEAIKDLEQGKTISLISESGMPLISDPGEQLVKEVIKRKLKFTVIPGATAFTIALIHSGFSTKKFMYLGFLPKKQSELKTLINKLMKINKIVEEATFVTYVSIHRLNDTLKIMDQLIPDADICICREMTKKFEEIIRGKPKELMDKKYKGEITLVLQLN